MRSSNLFIAAFLAILAAVMAPQARAQAVSQPVETGNAVSQLIAERGGIAPGETIRIGLYQELREGWHVYWMNPGDSGLPLEIDWTLPEGFETGEIDYPLPHRIPLGPLVNFGHEGTPLFMIDLTAPSGAATGQTVTLTADATWLICADICIPESATLSLSLPVVAEPAGPDALGAPLFEQGDTHMPEQGGFDAAWYDLDGKPVLELSGDIDPQAEIFFFPAAISVVEPAAEQKVAATDEGVRLFLQPAFDYDPASLDVLDGVVTIDERGIEIAATQTEAPAGVTVPGADTGASTDAGSGTSESSSATPPAESRNLWAILGLAFLGGIILNVMPCVFPVIFIKAASLAHSAQESRATIVRHGFIYTAGILVAFLAIAGLLLALRAGGEQIGWGFHLQSPVTVAVFAIVIFLVGLNLAGLFEIGTSVQGVGTGLASKGGNSGAFFTGLLAVAVAAPCIGPFLGVPVGFALSAQQPAFVGLLVFAVMGLGLALPYLLISLIPGIAKALPKPGAWMEVFKQVLSFAMFATLIWLIWTLTLQAGSEGLVLLLIALLLTGFAAWAFGLSQRSRGAGGVFARVLALAAIGGCVYALSGITPQLRTADYAQASAPGEGDLSKLPTVAYSEATLEELREAGTPVFIDFTAAWCVTCQVNKQTVLTRQQVVSQFHEKGVVYMVADWTVQDPEITRALEAQGRSGVPLYLFYAPGAPEPQVLPQVLSFDIMRETFSVL
ncbi:thiol:disulfide interchange protein [Parvularcula flava]|uniref:Thiol:disulfide interchange protein n=1 Tax=Aquisalinus luteolus TaxID=1566827 RepID=A0A8J3A4J0_9PROT|nr:thioredoxin family protein [Aquisalinus luteolus]NHK28768.1 thiol:disulfide interchange protein [Aquisalinus luteolus]GGH99461.1 thiol:disulfide interchange protein DsbD [Aquisalinus luteolus]